MRPMSASGPETTPDLKAYAEDLKARMLQWGGITKVEISGFSDHQIRIELDDATLRQFGLSASDIATKIARQSFDLPAGSTAGGTVTLQVFHEASGGPGRGAQVSEIWLQRRDRAALETPPPERRG